MTKHNHPEADVGLKLFAIILSVFVFLAYFIFRLFEPVFVWIAGWQTLSNKDRVLVEQTAIPEGYADIFWRHISA